jgi:hypothetical protein
MSPGLWCQFWLRLNQKLHADDRKTEEHQFLETMKFCSWAWFKQLKN